MWDLADLYIGWFATECGFTPDQVHEMPWVALIRLTLMADDRIEAQKKAAEQTD